jgi:hypothetical protein
MGTGQDWIRPSPRWAPRRWTAEEQKLITWYIAQKKSKRLPSPPFRLNQYAEIVDGDKFYAYIDRYVATAMCEDRMVLHYVLDLYRLAQTREKEASDESGDLFPEDAAADKPVPAADEAVQVVQDIFE